MLQKNNRVSAWVIVFLSFSFLSSSPALGSPESSVLFYGAVGDGVADDTAAFERAFSASKNVFIPNGSYLLKQTITLESGVSIVGENKEYSILLFEGVDGINFIPKKLNDGRLNIDNITIQYKGQPVENTKGIDFSGVNYSRVNNTNIKFFGTGVFLSRLVDSFGVNGCFFNNLNEVGIYWSKVGVDLNDASGYYCNNNSFSKIYYKGASLFVENALAFENHTAYKVTGYGNSFYSIYGGGYHGSETTFMEFTESSVYKHTVAGHNTILNPYIESSPKYGFRIPKTTSGRQGNLILNPTFDGIGSQFKFFDPKNELVVVSAERNDMKNGKFQRVGNTGTADLTKGEDIYIFNAVNRGSITLIKPQDSMQGVIVVRNLGGSSGPFIVNYSGEVQGKDMIIDSRGTESVFEYNYIKLIDKIFIRKVQ